MLDTYDVISAREFAAPATEVGRAWSDPGQPANCRSRVDCWSKRSNGITWRHDQSR